MTKLATGINSEFRFQREDTYGSDPSVPVGNKIPIASGSGMSSTQAIIENTLFSGDPNGRDPVLGKKDAAGKLTTFDGVGYAPFVYELGLGNRSTSGSNHQYTHLHKIVAGDMPSWTVEESFVLAAGTQYLKHNGVVCESFKADAKNEGFNNLDLSLVGAKGTPLSGSPLYASPADYTVDRFVEGLQLAAADVLLGGAAFDGLLEFSVEVAHDLYKDHIPMGAGGARMSAPRSKSKVTGSLKAFFTDLTLYNLLVSGVPTSLSLVWRLGVVAVSVTTPGTTYTNATVSIAAPGGSGRTAKAHAVIVGGAIDHIVIDDPGSGYSSHPTVTITGDGTGAAANATAGSIKYDLPRILLAKKDPVIEAPVMLDATFTASKDSTLGTSFAVTVVNDKAGTVY